MKKIFRITCALAALALTAASCVSEKVNFNEDTDTTEQVGYLSLADAGVQVITDAEVRAQTDEAPDVDTFTVEILNDAQQRVTSFLYGERPATAIELPVGNYTLNIRSAEMQGAAWDAPVYTAQQSFSIARHATTSLGLITCKLANIKVTVGYSADLAEVIETGTQTAIEVSPNSLVFSKDETRAGFFQAVNAANTMDVTITLVIDGKSSQMSSKIENVKAGQWRRITVARNYSNEGNVSFTLIIETLTLDEEIVVDVTEVLAEEVLPEPGEEAATIVLSAGDIAQPYYLTASMFDADNKYTQPFTVAVTCLESTISALNVNISSTSSSFMASLTQMNITTSFDLCQVNASTAPTLNTALSMIGFPTGSQVLDKASVNFELQNLMGLLYSYKGTHDFSLTVTDHENRTSQATLSIVVDEAGETPASGPSIVWLDADIDQQYEVSADLQVKIQVSAAKQIAGFIVDIDSNVLTANTLQSMTLDTHIDLINPGSMEAMLSAPYPTGLGFPVKDQVEGQTELLFDITDFMTMILGLNMPGYFNFQLTVTDTEGAVTTKTVKLVVSA